MVAAAQAEARWPVRGVPVLMYHGIDCGDEQPPNKYWLTGEQLRRQLALLRDEGFRTVALADLLQPSPERRVVLTFDNGEVSDYTFTFRHCASTGRRRPSSSTRRASAARGIPTGRSCARCSPAA